MTKLIFNYQKTKTLTLLQYVVKMKIPRNKKVTLEDVSRLANVGLNTAAKVLAGQAKKARISEKTAKKVQKAAQKLGYIPNLMARNLRAQKTRTVAVFISDMTDPVYTQISHIILQKLHLSGFSPILTVAEVGLDLCFQDWLQNRVEGLVFCGTTKEMNAEFFHKILENNILPVIAGCAFYDPQAPVVLPDNISVVTMDNRVGMQLLIKHLQDNNRTRIAFITGPHWHADAYERESAYRDIIQAHHEPVIISPDKHLQTWKRGFQAAEQLIENHSTRPKDETREHRSGTHTFFQDHQPYRAIIAYDDQVAAGVIKYLLSHGIKVPQDIAVVGFDNSPLAETISPALTTIAQPLEAISQKIVDFLQSKLYTPSPVEHVRIIPKLIVRDSA